MLLLLASRNGGSTSPETAARPPSPPFSSAYRPRSVRRSPTVCSSSQVSKYIRFQWVQLVVSVPTFSATLPLAWFWQTAPCLPCTLRKALPTSPRIGLSNRRATRDSWRTCSVSFLPSSLPESFARSLVRVFSLNQGPQSVTDLVCHSDRFAAGGRKRSSALQPKKCRL